MDERSGFCTGVVKAVRTAEKNLEPGGRLYSLGKLVHNPEELKRLGEMGLDPIDYETFDRLENTTVLIRAHGEPPETFRKAEKQNIRLIDATCPIVSNLQKQIRECHDTLEREGKIDGNILIFGKASHPEVRALVGQTEGRAIVVRDPAELHRLDLKAPVHLFSQTTMNLAEYGHFQDALRRRMNELGLNPEKYLVIHDTICWQVSSREKYLKAFVSRYDLVFFVSGKESSNGKALYRICRQVNANTHFISSPEESEQIPIVGIESIGICGATSSPAWLLQAVKTRLMERVNLTGT